MKIHYLLPGLAPEIESIDERADAGAEINQLLGEPVPRIRPEDPITWKELLALNPPPPEPSMLAPPPSESSQSRDAAGQRAFFRGILNRHNRRGELAQSPPPIRAMLVLLEAHQKASEALFAHGLAEERG